MAPADQRVDYTPFLLTAGRAVGLVLVAKLVTALFVTREGGYVATIRWWRGIVPYLAFAVERTRLIRLEARSTLVAAVVITIAFALVVASAVFGWFGGHRLRRRPRPRRQVVGGWLVGVLALGEVLAAELIRHLLDTPFLDVSLWRWAALFFVVDLVVGLVWAVWAFGFALPGQDRAPGRDPATAPTVPALIHRKDEP